GPGVCPPLAGVGGGLRTSELWVNENGELVAETELGPVTFTKPIAYQEIDGKRVNVDVEYIIRKSEDRRQKSEISGQDIMNHEFANPQSPVFKSPTPDSQSLIYGFAVASYDKTKELVIDPLLASTYLGGSDKDYVYSIVINASEEVYVTGYTQSSDFPTTEKVYDTSKNDSTNYGSDIFISRLDRELNKLLASTYLGGSDSDISYSIALNSSGEVYVTGETESSDFSVTSDAYDILVSSSDVFISKLSSDLSSSVFKCYVVTVIM
ncbi:MAG: hypothetical protein E3K37_05280, partial [Candidatus Kuenenia sp.]|nr:hypothetical protein [Candidatus Kuenenia hertensis]